MLHDPSDRSARREQKLLVRAWLHGEHMFAVTKKIRVGSAGFNPSNRPPSKPSAPVCLLLLLIEIHKLNNNHTIRAKVLEFILQSV